MVPLVEHRRCGTGHACRLAGRNAAAIAAFEAYRARNPGFRLVDPVIVRHEHGGRPGSS